LHEVTDDAVGAGMDERGKRDRLHDAVAAVTGAFVGAEKTRRLGRYLARYENTL
jgi:hypothetical protein